ncbi:MAG: histidine phosphatase family protein [Proteobacteria bacterium]|nr:histidine phosphatase family protein [Pseudomonadota bacterium]
MTSERKALDGARRRRLYLFRHGSVDYVDRNGDWVADPEIVELNEKGRASDDDARFLGGERYSDFYARVVGAMESLLSSKGWNHLAIFAHGGTNAAVLGWVTGLGLLDQQTCCLNIVDFDTAVDGGEVVRKTVRAVNITLDDPLKRDRHAGDMEILAGRLIKTRSNG